MFIGATSVGLYDTLGEPATKYILNQTYMSTIICSNDLMRKIIELKQNDLTGLTGTLVNIVSMENEVEEEIFEMA